MAVGIANEKFGSDESGDEAMAKLSMPKPCRRRKAHAPTTTPNIAFHVLIIISNMPVSTMRS